MTDKSPLRPVTTLRISFLAVLLGLGILCAMAIFTGTAGADGDGGGDSGHGGSSGPGGGDDDSGDNSGPGGNGGPGGGDDDGEGGESEEGEDDGVAGNGGAGERGGDHYVRGEIVVANVDNADLEIIRSYGFQILEQTRLEALGLMVLRLAVPPGWDEERARAQVASALPGIIVDVNSLYAMQGQVALPEPAYGQAMIGWIRKGSGCGRGMKIGMVDTAVEQSLPVFNGARVRQQRLVPDAVPASHGTAVAAILVSQPGQSPVTGLVPEAELHVAAVFAPDETGRLSADAIALVGGLNWLAQSEIDVVNMSLAGEPNELVELAIHRMSERGVIFVAAAGNGGPDAAPGFPAAMAEVIGVTAIDSDGKLYKNAPLGAAIDFAAPGVRIWAPDRENKTGRYFSGTSFAAPFVTAAVALTVQGGAHGADAVAELLREKAADLGVAGKDSAFGWGLIKAPTSCGLRAGAS
jgi:subtilisin family serine protease